MKPRPHTALNVNAGALDSELRARIEGEVRFDAGSRALYATDASNYRQVPIGIVVPRTIDDVVETIALCREHGAPVLSRSGGTSLCSQCCNVAVVIDLSKYLRQILALDPERWSSWFVMAVRSPASTAMGYPRPSCCPRCTGRS
ncbi:MAG: FAD-binding oxidoreductase [Gammaproteobacteria bacterium]